MNIELDANVSATHAYLGNPAHGEVVFTHTHTPGHTHMYCIGSNIVFW